MLTNIKTKVYHRLRKVDAQDRDTHSDIWAPDPAVYIVGCQFLFLCCRDTLFELYANVSHEQQLSTDQFVQELKRDHIFYAQRDAYTNPAGIANLIYNIMLPSPTRLVVSSTQPIYINMAALNIGDTASEYDIGVTLYYVD